VKNAVDRTLVVVDETTAKYVFPNKAIEDQLETNTERYLHIQGRTWVGTLLVLQKLLQVPDDNPIPFPVNEQGQQDLTRFITEPLNYKAKILRFRDL
jgi:hypothetical protein